MAHNSLEYEYKQLKIGETPDLWGRIEPELNERQMSRNKVGRKFNVRKTAPILGIMVACLLVFIAFPIVLKEQKSDTMRSVENEVAENEDYSLGRGDVMPGEIIFSGVRYIWAENERLDIDPEKLTVLGYVEAVDNSQIAGAVVYENTDSSIIIEWQGQFYIYRLGVN